MTLLTIPKEDFIKRLKSLAWRVGMMATGAIITFLISNLGAFDFSPTLAGVIGLILGELSKQINKNIATLKGLAGQK